MGERGVRNAEVEGSNPLPSTITVPFNRSSLTWEEHVMAADEPRGVYTVVSLVMVAALVCDFVWVITAALHAME